MSYKTLIPFRSTQILTYLSNKANKEVHMISNPTVVPSRDPRRKTIGIRYIPLFVSIFTPSLQHQRFSS